MSTSYVFYDFITIYSDILLKKMREAFAMRKLLAFFNKNVGLFLRNDLLKFGRRVNYDVVSFEQLGPDIYRSQTTMGR